MAKKASKTISKWDAAPENIKLLHNAFVAFDTMSYDELDDKVDWDELNEWLEKVLDEYNELEAKHNADCGLISELEEDIDKANKDNVELKKALGREEVYSKKCRERIDELKADIDDLECELGKYKSLYENEMSYSRKYHEAANNSNEACNKLTKGLEKARKKQERASDYIAELSHAMAQNGIEWSVVDDGAFEITNRALEEKTKHYDIQLNSLREINRELRHENEELEIELNEKNSVIKELEKNTSSAVLQGFYRELKEKYDDLVIKERKRTASNVELRGSYRQLKKKYDELINTLARNGVIATNGPLGWSIYNEKLVELCKLLKNDYKFDVEYVQEQGSSECHWRIKQVGPNIFNRNSNNFRYAFKEACRYIGMTPGHIADEVRWIRLSDTTENDIINRWKKLRENAKPLQDKLEEQLNLKKNLDGHIKALKERINELEDRSKDIYKLATHGWLNGTMYEYDIIRKMLSVEPSSGMFTMCKDCKNYEPITGSSFTTMSPDAISIDEE